MIINNIDHLWTIACLNSSIDQTTNLISLFNIVDEFRIDISLKKDVERINVPINFEIVTLWQRITKESIEESEIKTEYCDPDGKVMGKFSYKLIIPSDKKRMRYRLLINGLSVTKNGTYTFLVSIKDKKNNKFVKMGKTTIDLILNKTITNKPN